MSEAKKVNPNSALHWLPAAEATANEFDIRVPETETIRFDFMEALNLLEGDRPSDIPWEDLRFAADNIGYPVFIRTDLTSAKHRGIGAVRAGVEDDVRGVVGSIIRQCADQMMRPAAFLVREWIPIEAHFTAKQGLPIGVEYRVFAAAKTVFCEHYYWPEDSIEGTADAGWRTHYDRMSSITVPPEVRDAAKYAAYRSNRGTRLAETNTPWSVDFARDTNGDWWLIDMAVAADSWHPEDCTVEFSPKRAYPESRED